MEPLTTLALGGIGWVVTQAAGAVVGAEADRQFAGVLRGLRDRLPSLAGTPQGDDLARGLCRAQRRALERVVLDYREVVNDGRPVSFGSRSDAFVSKALAFCSSVSGSSVSWGVAGTLEDDVRALALVGAEPGISAAALAVEDAVLLELRTAMDGTGVPDAFVRHLREGGRGRRRFLDLLGLYFYEELKENAGFRDVLQVHLLMTAVTQTANMADWMMRLEERFGGMLGGLGGQVADLQAEQQAGLAEQREGFAAVLNAIAAEKGVPIAPLQEILTKLGEADVPADQIPGRLSAMADDLLSLREDLSTSGNANADVAPVRLEAKSRIDAGDLDGAREVLAIAREAMHKQRARDEAALLADEARIDRLQLRYRDAANRYGEAEALVAGADAGARFDYLWHRADTLYTLGLEFGDNAALMEAITVWKHGLHLYPRSDAPLAWAMLQNNLGNALAIFGGRTTGTERLEEAIVAYRAALEECTRERAPLTWATTQNNLGNALRTLGERESGTSRLQEAVTAYHAALEERTRERVPLAWAMTQTNLGIALATLGERESGTVRLEEAITAFRAALEERSQKRVPLDWAATQNNLGNALLSLGGRESGTDRLEEAVTAFRAALEEWTRERVPLRWATTQNNLGNALRELGERESGTSRLEEAIAAYRAALEERTRERLPIDWARTQNNLGNALRTLGEREGGTIRLGEAVASYRAALEVFEAAAADYFVVRCRQNLESAMALLKARLLEARLETEEH